MSLFGGNTFLRQSFDGPGQLGAAAALVDYDAPDDVTGRRRRRRGATTTTTTTQAPFVFEEPPLRWWISGGYDDAEAPPMQEGDFVPRNFDGNSSLFSCS